MVTLLTAVCTILLLACAVLAWLLTRRTRRQETITADWRRSRDLIDRLPQIVFETDLEGRITYANKHAYATLQLPDELPGGGISALAVVAPDDRPQAAENLRARLHAEGEGPAEYRLVMKDGRTCTHAVYAARFTQDGEVAGLRGLAVDISARVRSEERFRALFDLAPYSLAVLDLDHRYRMVNRHFIESTGFSEAEAIGHRPSELSLLVADDGQRFRKLLERDGHLQEVVQVQRPDGSIAHLLVAAAVHHGQDDAFVMTATMNISEEISARQEVKRLATVVEQASEDVILTDLEGTIQYVNPAFTRVMGWPRDEVIGKTPRILQSGEHDQAFYRDLWATIKSGEVWRGRITNRTRHGDLVVQEATISQVVDHEGLPVGYCSIKRDVTNEAALERQVAQMQNLEAIGTMAGGIAHDFNNILVPILGYAELALDDAQGMDRICESLNKIQQAGERARELVRQILAFSREEIQEPQPVEVGTLTEEVVSLMRSTLPSTIRIRSTFDSRYTIMADPTRIHQVVMNLCTNAGQAMRDEGGTLTVAVRDVGSEVEIEVADTGCGIPPEVADQIFDPFFTTRRDRGGTGLGLAVVRSVVEDAGGAVTMQSEVGQGTTFRLRFPSLEAAAAAPDQATADTALDGTERILFVDDEIVLCRLAVQGLKRRGYRVVAESSSELALARFEADPDAFDAVITDVTMPGLTGLQLADAMLALRPDLPILLCTGFSELVDPETAAARGIRSFAYKPLVTRDLAERLRTMLDSPSPGDN